MHLTWLDAEDRTDRVGCSPEIRARLQFPHGAA
jgi:hypothetical protein